MERPCYIIYIVSLHSDEPIVYYRNIAGTFFPSQSFCKTKFKFLQFFFYKLHRSLETILGKFMKISGVLNNKLLFRFVRDFAKHLSPACNQLLFYKNLILVFHMPLNSSLINETDHQRLNGNNQIRNMLHLVVFTPLTTSAE